MHPDAVWQAMVDRRDLDVGFQNAEAALHIGVAFVAGDSLGGADVGGIGDQRRRTIEELRLGHGLFIHFIHRPVKAICGQVGFEKARQLSLREAPGEAAVGPAVGVTVPRATTAPSAPARPALIRDPPMSKHRIMTPLFFCQATGSKSKPENGGFAALLDSPCPAAA
jgi:hypothetical protein